MAVGKIDPSVVNTSNKFSTEIHKSSPVVVSPFPKDSQVSLKIKGPPQSFFHILWTKLIDNVAALYRWIKSWFCAEKKQIPYYRIDGDDTIQYRMKNSETEVKTGLKIFDLQNLHFNNLRELEILLHKIMKNEKIDRFSVSNLYHAWLLWEIDLVSENHLTFDPSSRAPLNRYLLSIYKKAKQQQQEKKLSPEGCKILAKIEKKFLSDITVESLDIGDNSNLDLHQSVEEVLGKREGEFKEIEARIQGVIQRFDTDKACRHLSTLQEKLGSEIDLKTHIEMAADPSLEKLALSKMYERLQNSTFAEGQISSYDIPIQDLFALVQECGMEIGKAFPISKVFFSRR